jgi:hypothetical protein
MLESSSSSRRQVVRRAVQLPCAVRSELWDGAAPFLATDLSPSGLRLCSPLALPEGQDVVVTFTPPRWPVDVGPVNALARVTHVELPRRKSDSQQPGMGLSFVHVDPASSALLELVLRGLPPPLPASIREGEPARVRVVAPTERELVLWHDGLELVLRAEAPLLTASAPPMQRLAPLGPPALETFLCEAPIASRPRPHARAMYVSLTRRVEDRRSSTRRSARARRPALAARA